MEEEEEGEVMEEEKEEEGMEKEEWKEEQVGRKEGNTEEDARGWVIKEGKGRER